MDTNLRTTIKIETQSTSFLELKRKIADKTVTVGIVGLGYVGIPLLCAIASKNLRVIGFDISAYKVKMLHDGIACIKGYDPHTVQDWINDGQVFVSNDKNCLKNADVILIAVPTPLGKNLDPDMSYIESSADIIADILRPGQLIVLESTTYPGTTSEILGGKFAGTGLIENHDFFVAYSPEREDPGNSAYHTAIIPKVVGADTPEAGELVKSFYNLFISEVVAVSSSKTAEAVKLTENIFRCVNIALVNELKTIYDKMGIDIWEVVDAAKTKPFGFMPFYPGPGIGGHCIPIDPLYLTWKGNEYNIGTRFIELATEINHSMPDYVVHKLTETLNDHASRSVKGSKILIIGLAYKKNIDDLRESPAFDIIKLLEKRGAILSYYDPVTINTDGVTLKGELYHTITSDILKGQDAALIITDHGCIDWQSIIDHSKIIIDTRNVSARLRHGDTVVVKA